MPPGIEPGTQGFSVLCSTNWAMAPNAKLKTYLLNEKHHLCFCECKGRAFFLFTQVFIKKKYKKCWFFFFQSCFVMFYSYLCTGFNAIRKVAQLVAYHVRDVGVGSSSLLFPTNTRKRICNHKCFVDIFFFLVFFCAQSHPLIKIDCMANNPWVEAYIGFRCSVWFKSSVWRNGDYSLCYNASHCPRGFKTVQTLLKADLPTAQTKLSIEGLWM